ncbi:MAG TPA: glycosyltransferase family 2 protein, partial [Candidatus Merdenecus merdavium]|nr:glycosyltransferase family 2 protein [Candidatus Merdenecus merdavium]
YALLLEESYAGISVMVSPHPSYPPLEMSVFGVKVITNTYVNKDLKDFNDHITSIHNANPSTISAALEQICNEYQSVSDFKLTNKEYCENTDIFHFIKDIKEEFDSQD